ILSAIRSCCEDLRRFWNWSSKAAWYRSPPTPSRDFGAAARRKWLSGCSSEKPSTLWPATHTILSAASQCSRKLAWRSRASRATKLLRRWSRTIRLPSWTAKTCRTCRCTESNYRFRDSRHTAPPRCRLDACGISESEDPPAAPASAGSAHEELNRRIVVPALQPRDVGRRMSHWRLAVAITSDTFVDVLAVSCCL